MGQRRLEVDWDLLLEVLKPTGSFYGVSHDPLPADARIVRFAPSSTTRQIDAIVESAEWPEVPHGWAIPYQLTPSLTCFTPHPPRSKT